jgi:hypothetical protein
MSQVPLTIERLPVFSLAFALVATAQHYKSSEESSQPHIQDLTNKLAGHIHEVYIKYLKRGAGITFTALYREAIFWQSVYTLAQFTPRSAMFRETKWLPFFLCIMAQQLDQSTTDGDAETATSIIRNLASTEILRMTVNEDIDKVWDFLSPHARWLGSQGTDTDTWVIPGFSRWPGGAT